MKPAVFALFCLLLVSSGNLQAAADPFTGRFSGEIDGKTYELLVYSDSPGNYEGELLAPGERLPMIGRRFGEHMIGKIGFPDDAFEFRGRTLGAVLLLERKNATPLRFFRVTE